MSSREKKEKEREGKQDSAKTVIYRLIRRKHFFLFTIMIIVKNSKFKIQILHFSFVLDNLYIKKTFLFQLQNLLKTRSTD